MTCIFSKALRRLSIFSLTFMTVSALSISVASAQVNDSGPSDSSLFDTVVNLPGDGALPVGGNIGGVSGETTQLNIDDGGFVDTDFNVSFGTEVNVNGGFIDIGFIVDDSEVNIIDGVVGPLFLATKRRFRGYL